MLNMTEHRAKPKRLIIFEGPDCAGKSTLMNELRQQMNFTHTVHHGPYPQLTAAQLPRFYMDSLSPLLGQYESTMLDRSWLSEPIYGKVFRDGQDRIGTEARRHLERIVMRHGAVVVLCLPPWEKVEKAWLERKGLDNAAEYLDRIDQLRQVYDAYDHMITDLPVVRYDYTVHKHQLQQLSREINRVAMPLHPSVGTAGNLDGRVILVGDKPSEHKDTDTLRQWPFCSFAGSGSSRWLTSNLEAAGIAEKDLLWINAESGLYQLRELYGRPVIALGSLASEALTKAEMPHHKVTHPQAHKRFHSSKPYELLSIIQSALK